MEPKRLLQQGLEKALVAQMPLARKNVERLRRVHPDDTPAEMIKRLERYYLSGVTASGGASGAAGVVPGAGIPTALADVMVFTEATALFVLSLAEVHGLHPEDIERRKLLVYTVLLGDTAVGALDKMIGRTGPYWARQIVGSIPMSAINRVNRVLGPRFVTKYGTKQGVLVLSKQVPLGIGAVLGGGGNHVFGRVTVRSARKIFGASPEGWSHEPSPANGPEPGPELAGQRQVQVDPPVAPA
jgi:hypothetical protein